MRLAPDTPLRRERANTAIAVTRSLATQPGPIALPPDWTLLRDITELHSLGAYIRLAPSKPAAATELRHRLHSLRTGDASAQWHATP